MKHRKSAKEDAKPYTASVEQCGRDTIGCGCTCGALLLYGTGLLVFWSLVGYGIYTFILYLQRH